MGLFTSAAKDRTAKGKAIKFAKVELDQNAGTISYKGEPHPLPAQASVETVKESGLGGEKNNVYLNVSGEGFEWSIKCNPFMGKEAREFSALVNGSN